MSIAILAKKSRAQRGASTLTGWTLATTKSGKCPGPCGGGAPAKQKSFRLLMKNKQQGGGPNPGGMQSKECCKTTYKEIIKPDGDQSASGYTWKKKQLTHDCVQHCIPGREHHNTHNIIISSNDIFGGTYDISTGMYPGVLGRYIYGGTGYWIHENSPYILSNPGPGSSAWEIGSNAHCQVAAAGCGNINQGGAAYYLSLPFIGKYPPSGQQWHAIGCSPPPDSACPQVTLTITLETSVVLEFPRYCVKGCSNDGCKCNCNKSLGGTSCCNVHKDMPPISISENIPWVVEARTCHKHWNIKPPPQNNAC